MAGGVLMAGRQEVTHAMMKDVRTTFVNLACLNNTHVRSRINRMCLSGVGCGCLMRRWKPGKGELNIMVASKPGQQRCLVT